MAAYGTFLFLGLGNGAVFAALAMALVVTYRSSGVLNFATGAQSLYAAYTYTLLRQGQLLQPIPGLKATISAGGPMGFVPALLITLAIQAVLGAVMYALVFRPLRNHRAVAKAVASLGLATLLTALVNAQVGTQQLLAGPIYPQHSYTLGRMVITGDRVWFALTIVALALALTALYRLTRFGLETRAAAESEVGALLSGLSPDRIALINWGISSVVAGLAGILIAPLVPLVPGSYTLFIVPALAAAVVGRFYHLTPAVVTGLALGALESVAVYLNVRYSWFPAGTAEVLPLIVVLVMLVARGKPEVLYVGTEYCPYCAAQSWAVIVALSRFGTFTGLSTIRSGNYRPDPNLATWTFYGSAYSSRYLAFVPVETKSNVLTARTANPQKGSSYTRLQTLTAGQQAIYNRYDKTRVVPFLDFGNRSVIVGSSFDPLVLQKLTWSQIAASLRQPVSLAGWAILGAANYFTAAICQLTDDRPARACTPVVRKLLGP